MPAVSVSMVCESTAATVTAALRESLGGGSGSNGSCSAAANVATGNASDVAAATGISSAALMINGSNGADILDSDNLQCNLIASANRALLSKIDYEEVDNYGHSVLESLKSKYVVLRSNSACIANVTNGSTNSNDNATTCNNGSSNCYGNSNTYHAANVLPNGVGGVSVNGSVELNGNGGGGGANVVRNGNSSSNISAITAGGGTATSAPIVALTKTNALTPNASNTGASPIASSSLRRPNALHELPVPKRILFPRDNVRIGWKNGTRKWQIGVGMMNVGNTCYLNSTLQALFHVPSMANWLASETLHMERCDDGGDASCIICSMCKTLLMAQTHMAPIRPYSVYSKLRIICKHLIMGRQEDAHEFLRYLVEAMEKCYLSRFHNYKEFDQYSKETTPLNQILGGYLKSAVRCLSCNHVSVTFQHFQDLLLDIRKADTVEEALDAYFSRERLEDMGYKCESCKKKVSATKQFTLERAPIALCIQLKRFSMMGSKLNKQISIRPRLDLTKYLSNKNQNEQYTYKLVSMITHLGASQHCGHYTAIGLTESGAYYNFDDSCVRPISVQGVCNTNAYIIFYEMDNNSTPTAPTCAATANATTSATETTATLTTSHLNDNNLVYQSVETNGYSLSVKKNNISSVDNEDSDERLIGPQLPPGGLQSYNAPLNTGCNGIKLKSATANCTAATTLQTSAGNNPKILIHFKNSSSTDKTSISSAAAAAAATKTTTIIETTTTTTDTTTLTTSINTTNLQSTPSTATTLKCNMNGIANGYLSSPARSNAGIGSISGSSRAIIANDNSCGSEPEEGISSTTDGYSQCTVLEVDTSTLPSMPNLFDDYDDKTEDHDTALETSFNYNNNTSNNQCNTNKTSLVPYDLESDDDNMWNITSKRQENQSPALDYMSVNNTGSSINTSNTDATKTVKRCSSASLLDCTNDAANMGSPKSKRSNYSSYSNPNTYAPSFNIHIQQSHPKQKTDLISLHSGSNQNPDPDPNPIYEIFNQNHRKRKAHSAMIPSLSRPRSPLASHMENSQNVFRTDEKYDLDIDDISPSQISTTCKRAYSTTPPSPPLIQTKTGIWQVSSVSADRAKANNMLNQKNTNDLSPTATAATLATMTPSVPLIPPRTWINPFAEKSSEEKPTALQNSRPNDKRTNSSFQKTLPMTISDVSSSTKVSINNSIISAAVSELLQQSHRGYGAPVLSWNGEETEIQKELKIESREQRQQDLANEDENEMDRGRQKKVKQHASKESIYECIPAYNPSQDEDNQRYRWKIYSAGNGNGNENSICTSNGSGNSATNGNTPYRYYSANYRQQPYQRNKPKFQRYNNYNKYQRPQQQLQLQPPQQLTNGNNSYSSNNNGTNGNSSFAIRRET